MQPCQTLPIEVMKPCRSLPAANEMYPCRNSNTIPIEVVSQPYQTLAQAVEVVLYPCLTLPVEVDMVDMYPR